MKIIDAHTHIDYIAPDVDGAVCCATIESEWDKIVALTRHDNRVHGAFGVHPWFVNSTDMDFDKRLYQLLQTESKYMIGEIGLDKYKPDMETQIVVFRKQLDIAIKLKRSVSLHCVGAWDKMLQILKQYKSNDLPIIVVHDFNANIGILQRLFKYKNIMFSFGKNLVYGKNCCIQHIDMNKILVETDGKKDVVLCDVINKISDIKHEQNASPIIYNNTQRFIKNEQIA